MAVAHDCAVFWQATYDDQEGRFNQIQVAVHEAERVAEKERTRVRRAKEVRAMEEAIANDAARGVEPLRKPVMHLEEEYERMKADLDDCDARAEESRQKLGIAVQRCVCVRVCVCTRAHARVCACVPLRVRMLVCVRL